MRPTQTVLLVAALASLGGLGACGGAPPARTRVQRPCLPLAWIDEGRGSLAVQYPALGSDAWLALDLPAEHTVLFGQDRLAAVGVRAGDRHVLVPPLFGSMPHELEVVTEPERPFAIPGGSPAHVVGRLGRESLEGRVVEVDASRMQLCDRYADEVASVRLASDPATLQAPFTGRHFLVAVEHGEARAAPLD